MNHTKMLLVITLLVSVIVFWASCPLQKGNKNTYSATIENAENSVLTLESTDPETKGGTFTLKKGSTYIRGHFKIGISTHTFEITGAVDRQNTPAAYLIRSYPIATHGGEKTIHIKDSLGFRDFGIFPITRLFQYFKNR